MYSVAQQRVDRLRVEVEGGFAYHVEPFVHIVTRTSLRDGLAGEGIVLICVQESVDSWALCTSQACRLSRRTRSSTLTLLPVRLRPSL